MAKKFDDGDEQLMEQLLDELQGFVSELDDEQRDMLSDLFSNPDALGLMINKNYYVNNNPDYKAIAKPVAKWLLPLWRIENDNPQQFRLLLTEILAKGKELDPSIRLEDMRNYSYCIMADFSRFRHTCPWRLWGLLWLLEKDGQEAAVDIILGLLRQDYFFVNSYFFDEFISLPAFVMGSVGENRLADFYDYLSSSGVIPDTKPAVFEAIAYIAAKKPAKRLMATQYLLRYLNRVLEISKMGGNMQNMEAYVFLLGQYGIREAISIVRKIYEETDFMHVLIENADAAQDMIEDYDDDDYIVSLDQVIDQADSLLGPEEEDDDYLGY